VADFLFVMIGILIELPACDHDRSPRASEGSTRR